ncbi:leucine-rich repeat receptor protein kinase HPCA1 [Ricinus communis]|uniref:non-specific serine/threonine protein kinase n=1 Tax=Ricinus communis TaxID=3988 RepID=B9S062_RICCO|nr:leucine-rich repeat receptor protein kinase HPCA1 [Ricinus communis]EEF42998.1 Serine/threonine-protein kinase PBS1, putative [Ricinus communis]|eukprot:XP_002519381.1 probable leucine-rich repeat receptor-like protein kinase At5g49770 [Ricinus communis]
MVVFLRETNSRILLFLLFVSLQICNIAAVTNTADSSALNALKDIWQNTPPSWKGADPCGDKWEGIECTNLRVTSITLSSIGITGQLSGDISNLQELQILDLSYNKGLEGTLPESIGNLKKLTNLILVGCGFSGPIPNSIGSLQQLVFLSLNSNGFSGGIPPSIGNLAKLYWLDLADNKLEGRIPVSTGTTPGLNMLVNTKHFHFGKNRLGGTIPPELFRSDMTLLHVLFESNNFTGSIPSTLGLVQSLEIVRFDRNSLTGPVPSNLNNLTGVSELFLSNNQLTGSFPNLTGMNSLSYLDMSNNSFDASDFPSWMSTLQSLTTLMMENTQLQGQIPAEFFSLSHLTTVVLRDNKLNGTLDVGTTHGDQLLIDMRNNEISGYTQHGTGQTPVTILLNNPICQETGVKEAYCSVPPSDSPYVTPPNNCEPVQCNSNQSSSPNCNCAYPYKGLLVFRAPSFSDLENTTLFISLEQALMNSFRSNEVPVDSVSLSNPRKDSSDYLDFDLEVFPTGKDHFSRIDISGLGFVLSNQTFKPPKVFGPFYFIADPYKFFAGESTESNNSSNTGIIIGAAAGGVVLVLLLLLAGLYAYRQKKRAQRAKEQNNPFAHWDSSKSHGADVPQLKGARCFSFEELKKYTNNFSDANDIGSGGYGKVYRGILPNGQLVAIKRAQQGSLQGGLEFKTEIELLSRVHHKNLVSLLGFCFERGEQMLVYEFVANGSLSDSLSGKSGIRLDWVRRLKVALGSARGLAYMHELANPPIIHRDVKSTNILLDERLNAKVADFGLSKPMSDSEKGHVTTQVKGTMGYLDPEYYMTQQLTEKSDVYSFGVVMLELLTGKRPIERGKYIVREVKLAMDRTKDLYNLHELLDPGIGLETTLKGLDKFVDLAMKCVQELGADRPTMGDVVKEIENILKLAGVNPNAESASTSASYEEASKGSPHHPYNKDAFEYSGAFPPSKIDPQ